MKGFLLIFSLIYVWGIFNVLINIRTQRTLKDAIDKMISQFKGHATRDKNVLIVSLLIASILPVLYLLLSAMFINTFIFSVICFLNLTWSLSDMMDSINYIDKRTISKKFNSRLYKLFSLPFDIAFAGFILYQLFLKW